MVIVLATPNFSEFDDILAKSRYSRDISTILQRSKDGRENGGDRGMQESRNVKISQNVFKHHKTIIETRMGQSGYHPIPFLW